MITSSKILEIPCYQEELLEYSMLMLSAWLMS